MQPIQAILHEIRVAVNNGLPFVAVAATLSLPDICVSLAAQDGLSSGALYRKWCDDNLPKAHFGYVTGRDLWTMRCGVLHNGRFGEIDKTVARVIFMLPGSGGFVNCAVNDAYLYSVVEFCENFTQAVQMWADKNKNDPIVISNLNRMMQYRAGGLAPYVVGCTVIA